MKQRLLTPGPTPVPEETLLELARPVFFHRSAEFRKLLEEVTEDLKYVFRPNDAVLTLTASGTGGMEAAVVNCVPPDKKLICLISGRWGERFRNVGKAFGIEVISVAVRYGEAVPPDRLAKALKEHPDAMAVSATLSETSTVGVNDIKSLGKLVSATT